MNISLPQLWSQVLERLQLQLSRPTFETWIKTATAEELRDNCLVIRTPNAFVFNHLQKHYLKTIADVVQEIVGKPIEIQLKVTQEDNIAFIGDSNVVSSLDLDTHQEETTAHHPLKPAKLNPRYTFIGL